MFFFSVLFLAFWLEVRKVGEWALSRTNGVDARSIRIQVFVVKNLYMLLRKYSHCELLWHFGVVSVSPYWFLCVAIINLWYCGSISFIHCVLGIEVVSKKENTIWYPQSLIDSPCSTSLHLSASEWSKTASIYQLVNDPKLPLSREGADAH